MKFVDEAPITVQAGRGGDGCLSFRREKFRPKGGPDGGNGGKGGDVYLLGVQGLNTLADFRYTREFRAESGGGGRGNDQSGRGGQDLEIRVPLGTVVTDLDTGELIGDVTGDGQRLMVARGGSGGFGNAHFKSSVNRAPRRTIPGWAGEERQLRLELRVLADVGLLGAPNAGKSTFLRAVSQARPKVADYPFTTLYPELGVVRVGAGRSFVAADIPGLIEGASEGAGLGVQFLRHLGRTRLLLHLVDMSPLFDDDSRVAGVRTLERELGSYSESLAQAERWLVLNKMDLLPAQDWEERRRALAASLDWRGPVFAVSALTGAGCRELTQAVMNWLEAHTKGAQEAQA